MTLDDKTGVVVDKEKFVEQALKSKQLITHETFAQKYFKKRYLALLLGWVVLIWLLMLAPSMQTRGFVTFEPYDILGIEDGATEIQIKRAYRKLAMMWHPDKHPQNKEEAESKFTLIAKAYAALTDPRVKANMQRFGNPDGLRQGQSMTYGLPEFFSSKDYELVILIFYFLLFIVVPPALGYMWWRKSSQFHDTGVMNQTIGWYAGALNEHMAFNYIIEPFAIAAEFRKFNEQSPDKIEELKRLLNGQLREFTKHKYDKIYYIMLTSVVLHAHMQRVAIGDMLKSELNYILSQVHSLAHVLLELSRSNRFFKPAMGAIDLMQNATQAVWSKDSPLLQLPHITAEDAAKLRKKGIETIADFRAYPRAGTIKILGCSEAQYEAMAAHAKVLPVLQVEATVGVPDADDIRVDDIVEVTAQITRREDNFINETDVFGGRRTDAGSKKAKKALSTEEKAQRREELRQKIENWDIVKAPATVSKQGQAPLVLSDRFPHSRRETWYVMLVYVEAKAKREVIVDMRTLRSLDDCDEVKFLMRAPETPGRYAYELHVRSDAYVGCDVVKRITMQVDPVMPAGGARRRETAATSKATVEEVGEDEEEGEEGEFEEEDDFDDEEEEEEVVAAPGKWYYLGASSFLEFVLNMVLLSTMAYFAYNYLHNKGLWQRYFEPVLNRIWARAGPTVMAVHEATSPVTGPVVGVVTMALNRFLGVDVDLPMEVKMDKLNRARSKGLF
jgi:translocation protein SEC63